MKGKKLGVVLGVVMVLILLHTEIAKAGLITDNWLGMDISILYPDKVTFNTPFEISLTVDSTPGTAMAAFTTHVSLTSTVDVAGAGWGYGLVSDDPGFGGSFTGVLGDAHAPYTTDASGFAIDLVDPYFSSAPSPSTFTWLDGFYNDRVTWTLHDFVIQDHTAFTIILDDGGIQAQGVFAANLLVLDPPPAIPEPASFLLVLTGMAGFGLFRKSLSR